MKVLQVIDRLQVGGAERVLVDLSNLLSGSGVDVSVLSLLGDGELDGALSNQIVHLYLNRKSRLDLHAIRRFRDIISRYDIIHVHSRHNLRYVIVASAFHSNTPAIVFHDHFGRIDVDQRLSSFLKMCLNRIVIYVGVTRKLCDWAVHTAGLSTERVKLLENIVVAERVTIANHNRRFRKRLIMVGNFRPVKNYEFALALLQELNRTDSFCLDIYGKVVDIPYYRKVIQDVADRGLNGKVTIITDKNNIQEVLPDYTLALHTAVSETGPLVLIEYLANGVKFVSYNTGEVVGQVQKYHPDFVISSFDILSWRSRILDLLSNNVGDAGIYKTYTELFSPTQYLHKCEEIYQSIRPF